MCPLLSGLAESKGDFNWIDTVGVWREKSSKKRADPLNLHIPYLWDF